MLISVRPGESLGALVEDGQLSWFDFVRTLHDGAAPLPEGTVCLGRVRRVERGLQAAFLELGEGETAMLPARDARHLPRTKDQQAPIERLVHEGEAVLVRVSRPGREGKGPRVTTALSLSPPVRAEVEAGARTADAPAVLWRPPLPDPAVSLWSMAPAKPRAIEVDHEPSAAALRRALNGPDSNIAVSVSDEDTFAAHGIAEEVQGLSAPIVRLGGGGTLIIQPTAALTAIDINAGGALGSTAEDTALKVNLDAARVIARQAALRRLCGIVVIDFLRLKAARHRREIVSVLRQALEKYGLDAQISGIGAAGLVATVLPRTGVPLHERLRSPCPHCGGSGTVPDTAVHAFALLARIAREARHGRGLFLEAHAAPDVIAWIEARADAMARELERFAVTALSWHAEPGWPPDRIEIRPRS